MVKIKSGCSNRIHLKHTKGVSSDDICPFYLLNKRLRQDTLEDDTAYCRLCWHIALPEVRTVVGCPCTYEIDCANTVRTNFRKWLNKRKEN